MFEIYTDGSAYPNPGAGGWSAVIISEDGSVQEIYGQEVGPVTNNQMELTAAIKALTSFPESHVITLHSDSNYLVQGMKSWAKNWEKHGWRTYDGKPVKNRDMWEKLLELDRFHTVIWVHIPGHGDSEFNNRADEIAKRQVCHA